MQIFELEKLLRGFDGFKQDLTVINRVLAKGRIEEARSLLVMVLMRWPLN